MIALSDRFIVCSIFIAYFPYAGRCTNSTSSFSWSSKYAESTIALSTSTVEYSSMIQSNVSMDVLQNLESQSLNASQFQPNASIQTSVDDQMKFKSLAVMESVNESLTLTEGASSLLHMKTVHPSFNLTQTLSTVLEEANYSIMQSSIPYLGSTEISNHQMYTSTLTQSKSSREEGIDDQTTIKSKQYITTQVLVCSSLVLESFVTVISSTMAQVTNTVLSNTALLNQLNNSGSILQNQTTNTLLSTTTALNQSNTSGSILQNQTTNSVLSTTAALNQLNTSGSILQNQTANTVLSTTASLNQINTSGSIQQNQTTNIGLNNSASFYHLYTTVTYNDSIQQNFLASVNRSESAFTMVNATDQGTRSIYSTKNVSMANNQTAGLPIQITASDKISATINGVNSSNISQATLGTNTMHQAPHANNSVVLTKIPSLSIAMTSMVLYSQHSLLITEMNSSYIKQNATSSISNEINPKNNETTVMMKTMSITGVGKINETTTENFASQIVLSSSCFYKIVVIEQEEPTTVPTTKPGTTGIVINIPSSNTGSKVLETMFTMTDTLVFQSKTLQKAEILLEISNKTSSLALALVKLINKTLSNSLKDAELSKESFRYISHIDFSNVSMTVTSRIVFQPWAKITPELIKGILNETLFKESHEFNSTEVTIKVEVGSLHTQDLDECKLPKGTVCSAVAICINLPAALSFSCTCPTNYEGNGLQCVEVAKIIDKVVPIILAAVFSLMIVFLCGVIIFVIKKNATLAKVTVLPHLQYLESGT